MTVVLLATALLAWAAPAGQAAPAWGDGLEVRIRADDPLAPVLVLTNRGATACAVVAGSLGTTVLTRVEQGGTAITPTGFDAGVHDGLDHQLTTRLRTLAPGASLDIPLRVIPIGPTGHALETIAWSPHAALGAFYPIEAGRPLVLEATYAVPVTPEDGTVLCGSAAGVSSAGNGPAATHSDLRRWVVVAVVGVVLLTGVLALILLVGRRRRRLGAGLAGALVLLSFVGLPVVAAPPAEATITVDPSLARAWNDCSATLHGSGGDPAGVLPTLEADGVSVRILPANGDITHEIAASPTDIIIFWDPEDRHPYAGSGGNADPCTTLYHEMYHGWEDARGGQDHSPCVTSAGPSGLPVNEVLATRAQNRLRAKLGLKQRSHYGRTPLPSGDCLPPDQQPRRQGGCSGGCAVSNGDPHLTTFDGRRYDFQAVGEFIATEDLAGGFAAQVRQEPVPGSRLAAVNAAVAMDVAGDRVEVAVAGRGLTMLINGESRPIEATRLTHGGSVTPGREGTFLSLVVDWPDDSYVALRAIGRYGIVITVVPDGDRRGKLRGLFGDFDGNPGNDVPEPTFENLYPGYADKWRVDAKKSLFTYAPGTDTNTYTDRSFPDRLPTVDSLANRTLAEALCRRLGVLDAEVLRGCVLDVALTGQPDFALAAAEVQQTVRTYVGGSTVDVVVDTAGGIGRHTFTGQTGERVFVDVVSSDLPDSCGVLDLHAPDGRQLNSGCIINGEGHVDSTTLPVTGEYAVAVDPTGTATGRARLRVIRVTDQRTDIRADGTEAAATIGQPGATATFPFTGTAGQKVYVDVPAATVDNACGILRLVRVDTGTTLGTGCVINGRGYLDREVLPADGGYAFVVDLAGKEIGELRVRLYSAVDEEATIAVDGAPVTATVRQPGGWSVLAFTGTAGQRIVVDVVSSDLSNQCGSLDLFGPDGRQLDSGCVINGTGGIRAVTLPASGRYTLVLDPRANDTGQARVVVHR